MNENLRIDECIDSQREKQMLFYFGRELWLLPNCDCRKDVSETAFMTRHGLFNNTRMDFGSKNFPKNASTSPGCVCGIGKAIYTIE